MSASGARLSGSTAIGPRRYRPSRHPKPVRVRGCFAVSMPLTPLLCLAALAARGAELASPRWFPDRPVAWYEHDDSDVPAAPSRNHIAAVQTTLSIRDGLKNEAHRILSLEGARPALDVNALDEVTCSTWFCPRNHLHALTAEELAAGPRDP